MVKKPSKAQKAKLRKGGDADVDLTNGRGGRGGRGGHGRGRGRGRGGGAAAGGGRLGRSSLLPPEQQAAFESRKRTVQLEESAFSKLSPPVLERLNILASYAHLHRPVPANLVHFDYSRFGRARAENHQRILDQKQSEQHVRQSHPLAGWLDAPSKQADSEELSDHEDAAPDEDNVDGIEETGELRLPKRPKWRADMDTKTVLSQEAEVFRQWLHKTDAVVERAFFTSSPLFAGLESHTRSQDKAAFTTAPSMGGSRMVASIASADTITKLLDHRPSPGTSVIGSLYERNIEVYRQLWRVCERSDLVCVLADARCPLLHLPPSLVGFLERYMRLKVVIVLTKADIVPKRIVDAWQTYLKQRFPRWQVVATESYAKLERMEGQGARTRFAPYLSPGSRKALFAALRTAHAELVTPPKAVLEDEAKQRQWVPPCATDTDWEGVERRVQLHTEGFGPDDHVDDSQSTEQVEAPPTRDQDAKSKDKTGRQPLPYLTIGLIGQPNVGKSSLLNALFGAKVVRASKTPGKTKHFQTHFLVPLTTAPSTTPRGLGEESHRGQIRLCDSPGLVFPSLIGMEMQVFGAVLAISQVQAISSCIRFVAEHIPLERVLQLDYPYDEDTPEEEEQQQWTGVKVLEAVARRYGYKTAKANRWDVNRAGNLVMRAVAEGRIKWAFRPPLSEGEQEEGAEDGIWIQDAEKQVERGEDLLTAPNPDDEEDEPKDDEQDEGGSSDGVDMARKVRFDFGAPDTNDSDEDDQEEEEEQAGLGGSTASLFSALAVEDAAEEDEDDDDEDDDDDDDEDDGEE